MSVIRLLDAFSLLIILKCVKGLIVLLPFSLIIFTIIGQTTQSSEYFCINNNFTLTFTLSSFSHSALDYSSNCSLSECNNNISYCAPACLCSILESCDNITNTCSSNTSVCVINSCCQLKTLCLPLEWTTWCPSASQFSFSSKILFQLINS